jgi:transcription antitermination factor NusG
MQLGVGTNSVIETGTKTAFAGISDERPDVGAGTADTAINAEGRNWYAVHTCANHERRVAEQLALRGVEHFLPTYQSARKWKDRKVKLQLPLFPGYVFVQIELAKRMRVLQVPGVARLVGFDGHPAVVPEADLLRVREFLARGFGAEPHRILKVGKRVRVTGGPLMGMEGIVVRRKNRKRLVISFALIQQAMAVEVAGEDLAAV